MFVYRFPYDTQTFPAYELTFIWFCHATVAAILGQMICDTLCYGSVVYLAGHFKVVQQKFVTMKFGNRSQNSIANELYQLLGYHSRIICAFNDLNQIVGTFLFPEFGGRSLQLCVVAFQLTLVFISYLV